MDKYFRKINKIFSLNTPPLFKNVFKAVSTSASILFFGKIIQFLLLLYLANYLGPKSFTFLATSLVYAQLISLIIVPGGQQGLTASLVRAITGNNQSVCKSILIYSTSIFMFSIFSIFVLFALLKSLFNISFNSDFSLVTLIMLFTIFRTSITRGYGFIFRSLFFSEILSPLVLFLLIVLIANSNIAISVPIIWFFTYAVFEILVIFLCRKPILNSLNDKSSKIIFPINAFTETVLIQVANIFRLTITRLDMVLLSFFSGPLIAAPYALAQRFVQPITMLGRVLSNSTSPMLTRFHASGNYKNINQIILMSFVFVAAGSIFIISILYLLYALVNIYLSSEYDLNKFLILYLIGSQLCLVLSAPFVQHLLMTQKANKVILVNIVACILFILIVTLNLDKLSAINMAKYSFIACLFMAFMSIYFSKRG
tara:strand:- start:2120 stop:3397 length:1278 start_codon:yes stop_codon:yes gene_type:complete